MKVRAFDLGTSGPRVCVTNETWPVTYLTVQEARRFISELVREYGKMMEWKGSPTLTDVAKEKEESRDRLRGAQLRANPPTCPTADEIKEAQQNMARSFQRWHGITHEQMMGTPKYIEPVSMCYRAGLLQTPDMIATVGQMVLTVNELVSAVNAMREGK